MDIQSNNSSTLGTTLTKKPGSETRVPFTVLRSWFLKFISFSNFLSTHFLFQTTRLHFSFVEPIFTFLLKEIEENKSSFIFWYLAKGYSPNFTTYPLVTMLSSIYQGTATDGAHTYGSGTHLPSRVGKAQLVLAPCPRMLSSNMASTGFKPMTFAFESDAPRPQFIQLSLIPFLVASTVFLRIIFRDSCCSMYMCLIWGTPPRSTFHCTRL